MRKKRAAEVYAAEERKQMIIEWIVGGTIAFVGVSVLVFVFWLIGMGTGKW